MRVGAVLLVGCLLLGFCSGQFGVGVPYARPAKESPSNDLQPGTDIGLDRIQVVSSALRVTPHRDRPRGKRATVTSWRRPRQHQFVTKEDRVSPPAIIRVYPPAPAPTAARRKGKRIIYYATLPEIVRPPGWYDQRLDYYDTRASSPQQYRQPIYSGYTGYQGYHNNENEVTRVQSNIIDVTPPRNRFSSTPKFTIIDVEPPYNYNNYNNYNRYSYNPSYPSWQRRPSLPPTYDRPEPSLEPVKLEIPTTLQSASNSTDNDNSTRLVPDLSNSPISIRSSSKFIT
ncbi:uncharacterized protein LOC129003973 [Macrosteles quadrilineatus]|uniref:uncharacterized protein LOC129003973 n=1 Tax=Macrosteles quadrilineatus TaxID=74068 RepID=UPI0023E27AD1|nr:uncharacterized protein LOC129003973 [Macrosteles quadrilineatus]